MKVSIHQPQYLPWLGYFDKLDQADCFVILDQVQFKKNEWQNRNRIKTAEGWQWLTVPVHQCFPQRISDVAVNNAVPWPRKHLRALTLNYASAPAFDAHRAFFEEVYAREWKRLAELTLETLRYLVDALGIRTQLVPAASLDLPEGESSTARLVSICRALGADAYLSGTGGRGYLALERFAAAGIGVSFQAFECPPYPQRFGPFEPNLSIVDLLFNCGEASLGVLRQGRRAGEDPGDRRPSG